MLRVYGRKNSINVQKVLWLIDELALPFEHVPAGGNFGVLDTPKFLAMNPHGKIPVICDDTTVIWESQTILRYISAKYGKPQFWSDDPYVRSQVEQWMDWSQSTLQPEFMNGIFWGFYRTPENLRNIEAIQRSIETCSNYFKLLDNYLENKLFLCGSNISLADIAIGTLLYRYFELDIKRPQIPNVEAWYSRLKSRAPYQKNVMIPFQDLYGRLNF